MLGSQRFFCRVEGFARKFSPEAEEGTRAKAGLAMAMEEARSLVGDATTSFGASAQASLGSGRRARTDEEKDRIAVVVDDLEDSSKRGKLLLGVANAGGSLTWLLRIALVAWGIRQLRSVLANRRQRAVSRPVDQVPFAMLSPVAVRRLVELDPVAYVFVDVRFPSAVNDLPAPFEVVINIPESELRASLQLSEAAWEGRFPSVRKIGYSSLIVFLSTKGERARRSAKLAADLGYSGCYVLSGGIEAYVAAMRTHVDVLPLKFLSRDAVARLIGKDRNLEESTEQGSSSIFLLDVRRDDERATFGHIRGSQNIPVTELPKALTLDNASWEKTYHFPKLGEEDTVIFQCRLNGRASWAAQVAQDAGLKRCFVYKDGVLGWRLDPNVQPYNSYKLGDTPPEPINFEVDKVDQEGAREELQQLGLE